MSPLFQNRDLDSETRSRVLYCRTVSVSACDYLLLIIMIHIIHSGPEHNNTRKQTSGPVLGNWDQLRRGGLRGHCDDGTSSAQTNDKSSIAGTWSWSTPSHVIVAGDTG